MIDDEHSHLSFRSIHAHISRKLVVVVVVVGIALDSSLDSYSRSDVSRSRSWTSPRN